MSNYIGNEIGQLLIRNQSDMSDKVADLSERITRMEQKLDGFEIPSLWGKARYHDKVLYMVIGGGFVLGWFTRVIFGK